MYVVAHVVQRRRHVFVRAHPAGQDHRSSVRNQGLNKATWFLSTDLNQMIHFSSDSVHKMLRTLAFSALVPSATEMICREKTTEDLRLFECSNTD